MKQIRPTIGVFAIAVWLCHLISVTTYAGVTLAYSFESPPVNPDGFGPNGGGITVAQDTIGTTVGSHSLKTTLVQGTTFVGALTTNLPVTLNNPPGVDYVLFDLTIAPGDEFPGTFANVGVTVFGHYLPFGWFGLPAQFADFEHIDGKAAGTYQDIRIDLTDATNPVTFAPNQSFNQIFGTGPNQLVVSGFQLYINKSNDAPLTVYIDNVRLVNVPEPTMFLVFFGGIAGVIAWRRWHWLLRNK